MRANIYHNSVSLVPLVSLQFRQFLKRKSNWLIIVLFLLAGLYALRQGYEDKKAKVNTIQSFRHQSDSLLNVMKAGIAADTTTAEGRAAYFKSAQLNSGAWNTRLPSFKDPVSTALYNIGQSDVFTYYYLFAAENFEMQWLKQTEIANPLRSLAGHFDVSFWIVYLLPLMTLLLSFNALSEERDNGNWRVIAAQGISEQAWLRSRLLVVALLLAGLTGIIAAAGTVINLSVFSQHFAVSDGLFFLAALVYLFFWLSLFYFINCLRRTSAYNAMVSGIAWISCCLVLPVLVSKAGESAIPVDNTQISHFSRRPQDNRLADDKKFAAAFIQRLAVEETTYRNADPDTLSPAFYLRTYHAWHLLLHKERWPVVQQYFRQVEQRQSLTNWSALINPAAGADGFLTALADNDAAAFHRFAEETEQLHDGLHRAMFGSLFARAMFEKNDYDSLPAFRYSRNRIPASIAAYYLFILMLGMGLLWMAHRKLRVLL